MQIQPVCVCVYVCVPPLVLVMQEGVALLWQPAVIGHVLQSEQHLFEQRTLLQEHKRTVRLNKTGEFIQINRAPQVRLCTPLGLLANISSSAPQNLPGSWWGWSAAKCRKQEKGKN